MHINRNHASLRLICTTQIGNRQVVLLSCQKAHILQFKAFLIDRIKVFLQRFSRTTRMLAIGGKGAVKRLR